MSYTAVNHRALDVIVAEGRGRYQPVLSALCAVVCMRYAMTGKGMASDVEKNGHVAQGDV
jgi:hypothetical protein